MYALEIRTDDKAYHHIVLENNITNKSHQDIWFVHPSNSFGFSARYWSRERYICISMLFTPTTCYVCIRSRYVQDGNSQSKTSSFYACSPHSRRKQTFHLFWASWFPQRCNNRKFHRYSAVHSFLDAIKDLADFLRINPTRHHRAFLLTKVNNRITFPVQRWWKANF